MIILYSLPGCGKCELLKKKMTDKNIEYEVIEDSQTLKAAGVMTVPVLKVDGTLLPYYNANSYINNL